LRRLDEDPLNFIGRLGFAAASVIRMGTQDMGTQDMGTHDMGTQEMTRYGMKETDFQELSTLLAEIVNDGTSKREDSWRGQVKAFRARFTDMHHCF